MILFTNKEQTWSFDSAQDDKRIGVILREAKDLLLFLSYIQSILANWGLWGEQGTGPREQE